MFEKLKNQSNSGALIDIKSKYDILKFYKKVSYSKNIQKNRTLKQIEKQNFWTKDKLSKPFFSIPIKYKIYKKNITISMPFIYGHSGSDILNNNSLIHVNKFTKELINLINFFKNKKKLEFFNKENIIKKIMNVKKNSNTSFDKYFNKFIKKINYIPIDLKATECHGDLTLSNMIVAGYDNFNKKKKSNKDMKIYLIDWLDNDFETFYFDLAKLKQDLYYGWSSRNLNSTDIITNSITGKYIWNKIESEFINTKNYKVFNFFMFFCILRIIPYAKKNKDIEWIKKVLDCEIVNF